MTSRQSAFFSRLRHNIPISSAHRAGNTIESARSAHASGIDLLELDVWHSRGQLQVRHKARLGPLLREGWRLHPGWGHQLTLDEMLANVPPDAYLLIDLKNGRWGDDLDLGSRIVDLIETRQPDRNYALCGRAWHQLAEIAQHDVPIFYSVGDHDELAALPDVLAHRAYPAASIKGELMTIAVVARLREMGAITLAWTINTNEEADRLIDLGVDGITSDNMALLQHLKP